MNKDLYRLIYNRALRLWQVASELATAPGGTSGPSPTAQPPARACLHPIPFALWLTLGWVTITGIATAQVVADPHAPGQQRPTVLAAPNGTPLIHIQTPSPAGVSRNTYQQFDITPQGAILNNARTPAQTHLAGTVQGNPWLAAGTAKIILNEVNSSTPTQLHGSMEVAGARAQLIIANPSGITCNGCGVINAHQLTLTTGTPVFNTRGALEHYRVQGGAIQIDGLGLDSRSADYTALIARTVQLNAGLWAHTLQTTTGPATVALDGHPTASLPAPPGDRPTVALDVSALGGMYAGKITLIGTEHGLGVRNAGQLSATSAPLTVTVDGLLENTGRLQSATDTQLNATAQVNNSGLISAAQTLTLHTPTTIDNRSGTLNAARLDITGARLDNRGGHIQQTGLQPLTLQTQHLDNQDQGRLGVLDTPAPASPATPTVTAPISNAPPTVTAPPATDPTTSPVAPTVPHLADGTLTLTQTIDNRGGHITAGGAIDAILTDLDNRDGTAALNRLTLQGQRLDNQHGILSLATDATIHTHTLNNAAGQLHANGALDLTAQQLNNASGQLLTTGPQSATLTIAGLLDNQHGIIASAANVLTLKTGHLNNAAGQLHANGTLDLTAQQLNNASGQLLTTGPQSATLTIAGLLDNTSGTLASTGSLTITAATLDTTDGTLQSGQGPLHIDAATLTAHRATLTSQDTLTHTGTHTDLSHATTTAQHITIHTDTLTTAGGHLTAYGEHTLQLNARTRIDNTAGTIATNGTLDLHTAALDNTGGTLHSTATGPNRLDITDTLTNTAGHLLLNGPTTLTTATWTNTGGQLQITGPATLHATTLDNRGGVLHTATGPLDLRVTGTINNQDNGLLSSTDALTLTAASLHNQHGTLDAAGPAHLTLTGLLDNTAGLLQTADTLSIDTGADSLTNRDGGTLLAAGTLDLHTTTLDNRGGTIDSRTATHLHTTTIDNTTAGHITSSGTLQIDGTTLTNTGGRLHSDGDTRLHLQDTLNNHDGRITAAGTLDITTTTLDNHSTPIAATPATQTRATTGDTTAPPDNGLYATHIQIASTTLDNTAAHLSAAQNLTLTLSDTLTNTAGHLSAGATLDLTADHLSNHTGTLLSGATQTLTLHRLTGDGRLHAGNALTLTLQDSLDTASTFSATGLLTLTTAGDLTNRGLIQAADLTARARDITTTATGQLLATGHTQLTATGTLNNSGHLQAADLTAQANTINNTGTFLATSHATLTAADTLTNSGLLQAADLTAQANTLTNTATGRLLTTAHTQLTATDTLTNSGLVHAGDLTVHARDITNTATGQLIANNLAQLTATATLTNRGLIDAFTTHLSAATIDNLGTGRLYGDHIALQAQTLTNRDETSDGHTHTATIAARQRLDIGADTLRNTANAMILSDGDAAIGATLDNALHATGIAALLDNRSATIDITGTLNITTTTLNNIRENVHIAHAPDVVTEARLEQPHWRKNKPNGGSGDFRLSSNYDAHEIYYLNPADILKDEPYITPDGQQIRRAIVRLTPQTSAYFYARGGLYASQAERRRMDLTARTGDSVLLYYTDRQDKQPNPDHSAAAATNDSAFIGLDTPQQNERLQTVPITYAPGDDRLTYDPTYGTCTDDCVRLVTWHDYTDPDRTLIDMHRGPNDVRDNERERQATKTTQQEILNPDAGAPALIQSGGTMRIDVGYLYNHYADLLAGGDQTIVGLPPHPTKETADDEHKYNRALLIDNRALQLSRTDTFHNISTTYRGDTHTWTNESRTTPTTQIGGRITSGGHQHIAAQTFNNVTDSTHAPEPIQHVTYNPSTQTLTIADGHITVTDNSPSLHSVSLADNGFSHGQELTYIPEKSITTPNAPIRDPAAPPAVTVTPTGPLTLPNNSLFTIHPDTATLITTDPRFTLGRPYTSADSQLHALGDHDTLHKRLGDGYYEQRLIREQIAQLTGRRRLDGYTDDDHQYRALLDAGLTVAKQHQLRPGIALSADQMAQLTSDIVWLVQQDVHLPDGTTTGALVPRLYLRPRTGDLTPDGALLAAASTTINAHTLTNTGTIDARDLININTHTMDQQGGRLTADAINIHTTGDFTNLGGQFTAGDFLKVHAQGNFLASSTLRDATTQGTRHHSVTELDQQAGFTVTGPGAYLGLSTNQAMTQQAVAISNTGTDGYTFLKATGPLHLGTLNTHRSDTTQWDPRNSRNSRIDTEHGTSITGNGDINISADVGITGRAVTLDSSAGDLTLTSRHGAVTLLAGEARLSDQQERTSRRSGLLRSSSSHSTSSSTDTVALSSVLGGKNITITAADTVHSVGTQFIADQDIDIFGTKGVRLESAQNTHSSSYTSQQRSSGLSRAGLGVSIGSSRSSEQGDTQATSSVANTVAALNGNITIHSSQGNVDAAGSELLAAGNLSASGVNVDLGEVYDTLSTHEQQSSKQSGLTIGFNSALTSTAQGVSADLKNRRNAPTGRLSSLYGWRALSTAASAGYQAYGEIDTLRKTSSLPSTFQIGVSVGTSSSQSQSSMSARTARGTQLRAGGDISITAFGVYELDEKGKPTLKAGTGNINATAAQFSSHNLNLTAAGNLDAHSAQSTQEQTSSQRHRSASLGAKIGVTGGGTSVSADVARGRGSSRQQSVTQVDTVFTVANHATISVGGDATMKGAHLNADSIKAKIGGNLDITSLQDTLQASAQQRQTSIGGTWVINGAGSTATFSRNRQDATQDYASVRNQSGLFAGAGGYDITVGGHSQFNGGALTSTAPQALQAFSTNTIGYTDIHNHNSANASASGITIGSDLVSGLSKNNPNGTPNLGVSIYSGLRSGAGQWMANADRSVNQHSTTAAVVSAANIQVSDPGSSGALATLRRDPIGAHQALSPTDLGALQTDVQQRSQGGALLADIGRTMVDQSISNMLTPTLNRVFCIQQPCTNDHVANDALVKERTEALRQAHPGWSDRKLRQHAVAELALTDHNANRVLDQDKVKEMIANKGEGHYSLQHDLLASGRWGISRGIGNVQVLPVSLADLSRLSDEEKKNVTLYGNGISNDIHRAGELALQMTPKNDNRGDIANSGETYQNTTYQAYTKPTHQLGELVTAGIEKLLEITKIASPASRLKAAAAKELMYNASRDNYSNLVYLEGHSRGTMTLSNALRVLAADHVLSDDLKILAFNPAAEGNRLAEAAALVTKKPVKTWAPPKDFVANKIGGYAGNATFHDLREIFQTNYSVHSSGGTAALGSDSNHVDKEKLFSYEGLDIKDMNAKRQGRTIGLLQQWQKTRRPEDPVATQLTQLQRLLWQSGQWQQQLDNTPGLLTRPTPTTPDAPSARQQQLQQLRQSLTPY
ncbi:hemagglutinin repeat-containing protein [Xylella fastidiosa subsp. multiplex]|uniref:two-partner secretion domain-containing protein n=5 Tax=Xylella fastidiosa TaxID=2371 RepID=UPI00234EE09C|nr:hemagglutinin repeat-containing protein [Xylella fastidiosa]MDC7969917.1 hemagglutinin repeat-containing protein [Xylella fastidiosa subsp. multiplex]MDC7970234.1 hemagglutinin repeat-containing protein [Xylella fastidiosa subsp. multiplex]WDF06711.1 hemagglutinin repeat-containing protein [Xylella fastidiosa subsp. multiplex]WDF07008.1 hemagglutinin repeat-containing protein [Xylella fastidiosa subsp. multiplex]